MADVAALRLELQECHAGMLQVTLTYERQGGKDELN